MTVSSTATVDLTLDKVTKVYHDEPVVEDLDLTVNAGEFVVLVGPSGCGKSTTLRMVAGLEEITSGELTIAGRRMNDLQPSARDIAMVFQNYALYPHLSVAQNIGFGLKRSKLSRPERREKVRDIARMLDIEPLLKRRPRSLSGGQRQRVAMGRAIVRDPKVFLFDEPLSNLDAKLRVQMRIEIKRLHQQMPVTTLYVTHDQTEAMTMADRVVVMNQGRIEQVGPPLEVYRAPKTRFVAEFMGTPAMNIFPARISQSGDAIKLDGRDDLSIPASEAGAFTALAGRNVDFAIRPENISLGSDNPHGSVSARVMVVEPLGVETLVYFTLAGRDACARVAPEAAPKVGETVPLTFNLEQASLFDPTTRMALSPS